MKIAVSGKGGSGKTTVVYYLAQILKEEGFDVLCIDCDPDSNLLSLFDSKANLTPISQLKELIEERTQKEGGFFKLNPFVSDLPDKYSVEIDGIRIMNMGGYENKVGCFCPENALIRSLISHLILERDEAVILDMPAGIEHITRGVARGVEWFLVVVEPEEKSIQTALRIKKLAGEMGLKRIDMLGNKVLDEDDEKYLKSALDGLIGFIHFDESLRKNRGKVTLNSNIKSELKQVWNKFRREYEKGRDVYS